MYYQDEKGNAVFVSKGLDPKFFMVFRQKPGAGGMRRVKSNVLPERKTREAAQRVLRRMPPGKAGSRFIPRRAHDSEPE